MDKTVKDAEISAYYESDIDSYIVEATIYSDYEPKTFYIRQAVTNIDTIGLAVASLGNQMHHTIMNIKQKEIKDEYDKLLREIQN